jgi:hypothetical protein
VAKYQLRLIDIPEDARASVVDTGRSAGPPLDRRTFNAVLMGSESMPTIIAESDIRGPISGLRQLLADAGCQIELIEPRTELGIVARLLQLRRQFLGLTARERYAVMGVGAVVCIATVLVLVWALTGNKESQSATKHATQAGTRSSSTAIAQIRVNSAAAERTAAQKSRPYAEFFGRLPALASACEQAGKDYGCMLRAFRKLHQAIDFSKRASNVAADTATQDYLKVIHFRFFRCLAEELSQPKEGDQEMVTQVISALSRPLLDRYGRSDCDRDRSAMYGCIKRSRKRSCSQLYAQLHGSLVEFQYQDKTSPWTSQFADHYADKALNCLAEEQKRFISSIERAQVHLFRYRIANAVEMVENTCQEAEYVSCAQSFYDDECAAVSQLLEPEAKRLVFKMTQHCDILKECR